MYQELYAAKVLLYDKVEQRTVYTNDGVHGRVGQYYNTRVEVVFNPERNFWMRKDFSHRQGQSLSAHFNTRKANNVQ